MEERVQGDEAGAADCQQLSQQIGRAAGDAEADHDQGDVGADQHGHADQSPFLPDQGEDEVVVRFGKESELLLSLPEPYPADPAGADRDQRLIHLVSGAGGVRSRVQEDDEAPETEIRGELVQDCRRSEQPEENEMPHARARREHDDAAEHRDQGRRGEVRLEQNGHQHGAPDQQERAEPAREAPESILFLHREDGRPHQDGQLGRLRWLKSSRTHLQPAARPVPLRGEGLGAREDYEDQQQPRRRHHGPRQRPPPGVGNP
ncbi:MAG: hypothetical protein OXI50_16855 [Gammaproteobacteria bacterium]|nr:hypothetical protein [Gammaproteobacteria bacterium]